MPNRIHNMRRVSRVSRAVNEPPDLRQFLLDWTHGTNGHVKRVRTPGGREFILVRRPMGLDQYELDDRPDGLRPHGMVSILEFHLSRLAVAKRLQSEDAFQLTRADCSALFEEAVIFYDRLLALLILKDWPRAIRDAGKILCLLNLVKRFAALEEDRQQLEEWRSDLTLVQGIAQAMMHLDRGADEQALEVARVAIPEMQVNGTLDRDGEELAGALGQKLRELTAHRPDPHPPPQAEFRREGDFWRISYQGQVVHLKATRGLQCLACLLGRPGQECHVLDLVGHGNGQANGTRPYIEPELSLRGRDHCGACQVLDPRAKAQYARRVQELKAELEMAESNNDPGRATLAREEMNLIIDQLASAVGLNGRDRRAGDIAERARSAICKRIKEAIHRIKEEMPALGHHLETRISTGYYCSYQPHPDYPVNWIF
jgi:hypothetical protein